MIFAVISAPEPDHRRRNQMGGEQDLLLGVVAAKESDVGDHDRARDGAMPPTMIVSISERVMVGR